MVSLIVRLDELDRSLSSAGLTPENGDPMSRGLPATILGGLFRRRARAADLDPERNAKSTLLAMLALFELNDDPGRGDHHRRDGRDQAA